VRGHGGPLTLSAGTILDCPPLLQIAAAAEAGFDGMGLRLDPGLIEVAELKRIRHAVAQAGLRMLDIEVIRLDSATPTTAQCRLIEIAAELGADWVLTVSEVADRHARTDGLSALCGVAAECGVGIALEFMGFTAVRTLAEADQLLSELARPNAAVLVDALHLARSGGQPSDVGELASDRIAYAQLSDARAEAPADEAGLAHEARHARLMPGEGSLDLAGLLEVLPAGTPVTVEVQSDELTARLEPTARAQLAYDCARRLLRR